MVVAIVFTNFSHRSLIMASKAEAILGRMSREERRLARDVRDDAAANMGMRRIQFMRAIINGDESAIAELKVSLSESDEMAGWEYDEERFARFLEMIINFIKAIMMIFGGL